MDKLKRWLLHNTSLKIISAILAFGIWLIVSNSANPERTESFSVPVTILNENAVTGNNKVYSTDRNSVSVSYTIRTNDIPNVKLSDFNVYADFKNMTQEGTVPVAISVSDNALSYIENVIVYPTEISVTTENIQQKKFAVDSTLIGQVAEGYIEGDVTVTPEYFYVKGPVSLVGQISSTGIVIDVSGATDVITGTAEIVFYDANGNILPNIGTSLSYAGGISYILPIYRTKSLSVNAFTSGSPASGYYVEGVETSPTFLTVYGNEKVLSDNSYILIPGSDLNIDGVSQNKTVNVNASNYLPEGLSLINPNSEIVIYIRVREIPETEVATEAPTTVQHEIYTQAPPPPPTEPLTQPETSEGESSLETETVSETNETETVNEAYTTDSESYSETGESSSETASETYTEAETEAPSESETATEPVPETEASHGDDV